VHDEEVVDALCLQVRAETATVTAPALGIAAAEWWKGGIQWRMMCCKLHDEIVVDALYLQVRAETSKVTATVLGIAAAQWWWWGGGGVFQWVHAALQVA
jgi:phage tail protein X